MPELTREEKLKLIEKLPQRLQDFLYSEDTGAALLYFGKKYNLPDEKISALSKIVADIILKITPITSLAQEINSKITSDAQVAMNLAQELNTELLAPIMAPSAPVTSAPIPAPAAIPPRSVAPPTAPTPAPKPIAPTPTPKVGTPTSPQASVGVDTYREPVNGTPEIIDLRKTPPPPMPMPISAAPVPPSPSRPLTFTKPIERPLIEAEPHRAIPVAPKLPEKPMADLSRPQYIIRPSGLVPTPTPKVGAPIPVERGVGADPLHDVLDLRKDKGEF